MTKRSIFKTLFGSIFGAGAVQAAKSSDSAQITISSEGPLIVTLPKGGGFGYIKFQNINGERDVLVDGVLLHPFDSAGFLVNAKTGQWERRWTLRRVRTEFVAPIAFDSSGQSGDA